jgi:hypothetical protein
MIVRDAQRSLLDALEAFELQVAAPVIAGELGDWFVSVQKTWEAARPEIRQMLDSHHDQFDEMANQDPEMLPRVAELKATDEGILAGVAKLDEEITRLVPTADLPNLKEVESRDVAKDLAGDGATLAALVRKQAVAVEAWFVEAFNRDRGVVD